MTGGRLTRAELIELIRKEIGEAWSVADWEENIADAVLREYEYCSNCFCPNCFGGQTQ